MMYRVRIDLPKTNDHIRKIETVNLENKLEAIFLTMRIFLRMLKERDEGFYESEYQNSPVIFNNLWSSQKYDCLFGRIIMEEF